MARTRIEYMDIMRGVMIILVVYCHISFDGGKYSIPPTAELSTVNYFLSRIRMPLFFFISGYFVYSEDYPLALLLRRAKNRLLRQLLPTLVLWAAYCLLFFDPHFGLLLDPFKQGYWFTLVAVEMFFLTAPAIAFVSARGLSRRLRNAALVAYVIALELAVYMIFKSDYTWSQILSLVMVKSHFPFFFFGVLYRLNADRLSPVLLNGFVALAALAAFCLGFWHVIPLPTFAPGVLGIVFAHYAIWRLFRFGPVERSRVAAALRHVGTMTLEIYLLHYFFLRWLCDPLFAHCVWLVRLFGTPLELPVYATLAIGFVGLCLAAVSVLKRTGLYPLLFPSLRPAAAPAGALNP